MLARRVPGPPPRSRTAAATPRYRHRRSSPSRSASRLNLGDVEVGAVPVEVHHVVGAARIGRLRAAPADSRAKVAGRSTSRSRPSIWSAPPRTRRLATDRNGTSSRPPGRQITSSTRSRSPAASGRSGLPRGLQVGADERPRAQRQRRVRGRVAQQLPRQARHLGRVGVHLHPDLAQPVPRPLPDPGRVRPGEHPGEQVRPVSRQQPPPRRVPARRRVGRELRRNPPGTSGPSPPLPRSPGSQTRTPPPAGPRHPARSPPPPPPAAQRHVVDPQHRHRQCLPPEAGPTGHRRAAHATIKSKIGPPEPRAIIGPRVQSAGLSRAVCSRWLVSRCRNRRQVSARSPGRFLPSRPRSLSSSAVSASRPGRKA